MIQNSFFIFPTYDTVTCTYNTTWRSIGVSGYNDWWQHLQCYKMMTIIRQKESQNSVVVMRPILHGLKCIYCTQCKIKQLIQQLDSICIKKKLHINFTCILWAKIASISVKRCLDSSTESKRFISAWNRKWRAAG